MKARRAFAVYLVLQSLAALAWWGLLFAAPAAREAFKPASAPDAVLLSFWLPDLVLFIGAALWAAHSLIYRPTKALLPLALHTAAGVYAALFCFEQWRQTGEAVLAALFMAPCLVVQPAMLWILSKSNETAS
jgi:hypothetical protein